MNKKRIMAFLLSMAMAVGLTACGEKAPVPENVSSEASSEVKDTVIIAIVDEGHVRIITNQGALHDGRIAVSPALGWV